MHSLLLLIHEEWQDLAIVALVAERIAGLLRRRRILGRVMREIEGEGANEIQ